MELLEEIRQKLVVSEKKLALSEIEGSNPTDDSRVAIPTSPDPDRDLSGRQKLVVSEKKLALSEIEGSNPREANDNQPATESRCIGILIEDFQLPIEPRSSRGQIHNG